MAYLAVTHGNHPQYRKPLEGPVTVGRALGLELWLDDGRLSRQHCRFEQRDGKWMLIDLNSRNGTFIRKKQVTEHVLADGDEVVVGDTKIVFYSDAMPQKRPSDPSDTAFYKSQKPSAAVGETMAGQHLTKAPRASVVKVEKTLKPGEVPPPPGTQTVKPKKPMLAFTRPQATPIVHGELFHSSAVTTDGSNPSSAFQPTSSDDIGMLGSIGRMLRGRKQPDQTQS
jgi:predicted component of type VI protein secretion system